MKTIVVATHNKHKLKEIAEMLTDYLVKSPFDFGLTEDIEETGLTFFENAFIKAKYVSERLNLPALSDDSGLCVKALSGAPGVMSARYAGDKKDSSNNALLLKNLEGITDRTAEFICCMVYYKPDGSYITETGKCEGSILYENEGENGFGYDPIFFSKELGKSLGRASDEEKNSVSHRANALKKIIQRIKEDNET